LPIRPAPPFAASLTPTPAPDPALARRAALMLLISSALFALMAAGAKLATRRLPGPEVALVRFVVGIAATGLAVAAGVARIRPRRWGWLAARGTFGGVAVVSYFASIQSVPVGVATLLNQTQPIYTMMFSWLLLHERPRRGALAALVFGLAGVTVIVNGGLGPGPNHFSLHDALRAGRGELLGVLSAVASGVAVTSVRAARRDTGDGTPAETAWTVFFSFTLLGALVTLPTALPPFGRYVPPTGSEWGLLVGVGLVSTIAQVIMSAALRHLTGVQSGIIAQLTVPLTVMLGIAFLGESLSASFLMGAALTVTGVLLAIRTASPRPVSRPDS